MALNLDYLNAHSLLYKKKMILEDRDPSTVKKHFEKMFELINGMTEYPTTNQISQLGKQATKIANDLIARYGMNASDMEDNIQHAIDNLLKMHNFTADDVELVYTEDGSMVSNVKFTRLLFYVGNKNVRGFDRPEHANYNGQIYPDDRHSLFFPDESIDASLESYDVGSATIRFKLDMTCLFSTIPGVARLFKNQKMLVDIVRKSLKSNNIPVFENNGDITVSLGFANKYNKSILNTNINKQQDFHNEKHTGDGYTQRDMRQLLSVYGGLESTFYTLTRPELKQLIGRLSGEMPGDKERRSKSTNFSNALLRKPRFESVQLVEARQGQVALKNLLAIIDDPDSPYRALTWNTYNSLRNYVADGNARIMDNLMKVLRHNRTQNNIELAKEQILMTINDNPELLKMFLSLIHYKMLWKILKLLQR